jgi:ankyrin repeat protein
MSLNELIEAVKEGNVVRASELLAADADVNGHGREQEWTPLNYACGRGDLNMVRLLLEKGADVFNAGRDQRTPYEIALAAGHVEVARLLRDAEDKVDPERAKTSSRRAPEYCKAYYVKDLRAFPGWSERGPNGHPPTGETEGAADSVAPLPADQVVFLHTDFTVTKSMWHGEDVLFAQVTPDWEAFCRQALRFRVPDDLELVAESRSVA